MPLWEKIPKQTTIIYRPLKLLLMMMDFTNFDPEDFLMDPSFQRYCSGENEDDIAFWASWIREHPEKLTVISEARMLFAVLQGNQGNVREQTGKFKALFAAHTAGAALEDSDEDARAGQWYVDRQGRLRRRALRIAAAVAVCVALAAGLWLFKAPTPAVPAPVVNGHVAYTTYDCDFGTRRKIMLSDGTVVILNSNSSIKVPDNFNQRDRQVLLDGAAFFEVVHDARKPFTVYARNLATVDIGTSFLIRAYDYETDIKVLLLTGKVKVETNSNNRSRKVSHSVIELNPGEKLTLIKGTEQLQTSRFDATSLESWRTGRLNFNNASFDEVMHELEMWYGVEFKVTGNQHKPKHFTGQFDNENLDNVLKVISFSMNCRYHVERNKVVIRFK